jgi:hypothetical protein
MHSVPLPVLPAYYLPDAFFFYLGMQSKVILIEANENYQKNSFRNRCDILSANGPLSLSVPLRKGKHSAMPIREVEIAFDMSWHKKHWQAIRSAYGSAPFFEHYEIQIKEILLNPPPTLFDLNISLIQLLIELSGLDIQISMTDTYEKEYDPALYLDLRAANKYQNYKSAISFPSYEQVFADKFEFQQGLSFLDLLMCQGPYAKNVLIGMGAVK